MGLGLRAKGLGFRVHSGKETLAPHACTLDGLGFMVLGFRF